MEGQVVTVPKAEFINDVEGYLAGRDAEEAIKKLNQDFQNYKAIEGELLHKKTELLGKVPELKKAIAMVDLLIEKDGAELKVDYGLSDQIFATARLKDVKTVKIWLGADILMDYELSEAKQILTENLERANQQLEGNTKQLELIKDFYTTTEVSIARIYNHDIMTRKKGAKSSQLSS